MSSQIKVNTIESFEPIGQGVSFPYGFTVSPGYAVTATSVNVEGTLTAVSFNGDGSALTNLTAITPSQIVAYSVVLS